IYEPLDEGNLDVRFLTLFPAEAFEADIHCRVYQASVMEDTYPTFKALLYCWGTPTPPQRIILNGSSLNVGPNLESALRHLRDKSAKVELWVDALCINQADTGERSSQVELMDSMYGDAEEVVVWLGDESHDSDAAMDLIKQWSRWLDLSGKIDACSAITNLLCRPYWERVWVVQEVACAKEVIVMCGRKVISFDDFEKACDAWDRICRSLGARAEDVPRRLLLDSLRRCNLRGMIQHRNFRITSYMDWDQPRAPFLEIIESCRHLKCSDPRDKIYGFLALGGPHTKHFTA
ncbi:heterokaryon incompatibility protein-domain-containing protein, partial [Lasiosphaeria hispida]